MTTFFFYEIEYLKQEFCAYYLSAALDLMALLNILSILSCIYTLYAV